MIIQLIELNSITDKLSRYRITIPRSGARVNRTARTELAKLTEREKVWSEDDQRKIEPLTNELDQCTLFALRSNHAEQGQGGCDTAQNDYECKYVQ